MVDRQFIAWYARENENGPSGTGRTYSEGIAGLSPTMQSLRRGQVFGLVRRMTRARQSVATAAWGFNPRYR